MGETGATWSWLRRSAQAAVVLAALLIMYVVLRCAVHRPTLPSREAGERDTCRTCRE